MTRACGCPESFPDWDGKDLDLSLHAVHILPLPTLFHMPLSYSLYTAQQHQQIEALELRESWPGLTITQTGFFGGRLLRLLESAQTPSRRVSCLPASYWLRGQLHQGGVGTIRKTVRELQSGLLDASKMPKELYLSHLTCPRCAEQNGGEKILILRRWERSPTLQQRVAKQ